MGWEAGTWGETLPEEREGVQSRKPEEEQPVLTESQRHGERDWGRPGNLIKAGHEHKRHYGDDRGRGFTDPQGFGAGIAGVGL